LRHGKWRRAAGRGLKRALGAAKVAVVRFDIPMADEFVDEEGRGRAPLPVIEQVEPEARLARAAERQAQKKKRKKTEEELAAEADVPELQRSAHERAAVMKIFADVSRMPWGPLPYRTQKGNTLSPAAHPGGWAWLPEYRAAERHVSGLRGHEAWVLRGACKCDKPYGAIAGYYMLRIEWDSQGGTGRGKVLKLGYNGCYGKFAQVIGKNPKYACRVVAGVITGATRGRLFDGIMSVPNPWNAVYAATDGIIATEPFQPPNPPENSTTGKTKKWLGSWELDTHDDTLFIVQSGFYFSTTALGRPKQSDKDHERTRTRGVPVEIVYDHRHLILEQWAKDPTRKPRGLPKQSTFHGAKSSIRKPTLEDPKYRRDRLYGRWTQEHRKINYVVSPKRSTLVDRKDGSYQLLSWALWPSEPMSGEYKKDPSFAKLDVINDEQDDYVEPLGHGVGGDD
jgi:hypothetical protein